MSGPLQKPAATVTGHAARKAVKTLGDRLRATDSPIYRIPHTIISAFAAAAYEVFFHFKNRSSIPFLRWSKKDEIEQAYQISQEAYAHFIDILNKEPKPKIGLVSSIYFDTPLENDEYWAIASMRDTLRLRLGNVDTAGQAYPAMFGMKELREAATTNAQLISNRIDKTDHDGGELENPTIRVEDEIPVDRMNLPQGVDIKNRTYVTIGELANRHRDRILRRSRGRLKLTSKLTPQFISVSTRSVLYLRYNTKNHDQIRLLHLFLSGAPLTEEQKKDFIVTGETSAGRHDIILEACFEKLQYMRPKSGFEHLTLEEMNKAAREGDMSKLELLTHPKRPHETETYVMEMETHKRGLNISNWDMVSCWRKVCQKFDDALGSLGLPILRTTNSKAYYGYKHSHNNPRPDQRKTQEGRYRYVP